MEILLIFSLLFALFVGLLMRSLFWSSLFFWINTFLLYLCLPVIAWDFLGLPLLLFVNVVVLGAILWIRSAQGTKLSRSRIRIYLFAFLGNSVVWALVIPFFSSSSMFHAQEYRALLGAVTNAEFNIDTAPIDITQTRKVDQDLALILAEKRLGEDAALGSQVDIGDMRIQLVGGKLYWVGPLNHSGFWKWYWSEKGTPGYVMVSATNERDVRLVQSIEGKKIFLKYNEGGCFHENLHRYLYENGFKHEGLDDFAFEIDESGKPFWVVSRYKHKVGFLGADVIGVVTIDAETGEISKYGLDEIPSWIDRVHSEDIVATQLDDWGVYVHGWPNWSDKDKIKTTKGTSLVYGNDGRSYWYTGMTSVGSDKGTVGFVLVDTKTKATRFFRQSGATEQAAMESAQGAVQEKEYKATFPILYGVSGVPTYFMTLKDKAGLVKALAFVSVEDFNVVGIGEDSKEALRRYQQKLYSRGNLIAADETVNKSQISGTVRRKSVFGENTFLLLEEAEHKLFLVPMDISAEIIVTEAGDKVQLGYEDGGNAIVPVVTFDNLALELWVSEKTQELEKETVSKK
jgi:hypothetical protein